jgi:aspartyl aminopeptidase
MAHLYGLTPAHLYGDMLTGISLSGFDRDLGIAGRVMVRQGDGSIVQKLVHVRRPGRLTLIRNGRGAMLTSTQFCGFLPLPSI